MERGRPALPGAIRSVTRMSARAEVLRWCAGVGRRPVGSIEGLVGSRDPVKIRPL